MPDFRKNINFFRSYGKLSEAGRIPSRKFIFVFVDKT